jgi:hypothetical protein
MIERSEPLPRGQAVSGGSARYNVGVPGDVTFGCFGDTKGRLRQVFESGPDRIGHDNMLPWGRQDTLAQSATLARLHIAASE